MQFFKSWKEIYTTVLRINHETFKDFIDKQKFSLINISLKENFLLEEVKVIFFLSFLEIYCNKDEAIFQWWRTMEKKKLLQKENLYQVLGNECFDKFFIEHQLFRKQHCATTHVSCSVCVAKKLVTCRTVILHCFSSSQRIQTKCERRIGNFFFFFEIWKRIFSLKRFAIIVVK